MVIKIIKYIRNKNRNTNNQKQKQKNIKFEKIKSKKKKLNFNNPTKLSGILIKYQYINNLWTHMSLTLHFKKFGFVLIHSLLPLYIIILMLLFQKSSENKNAKINDVFNSITPF